MQLRADQLPQHLQRHGLKACYTLHGDEPLLAQEAADLLRATARAQGFGERQVFTVAGAHFDWSGVLGAAQSMGLFGDKTLIDIRIPSGKPGKEGAAALQRLAQQACDEVLLLVQLPRLDYQQLKTDWFVALDQAGISLRLDPVERHQLPAWIGQRLAAQGQHLPDGELGQRALAYFADRVEGNLLAAHQELQKLALLHPPGEISLEAIESAVLDVARYDIRKLEAAVLAGQTARALRVLDGLRAEGEATVLVLWTLAENLRALHRVRDAMAQGKPLPMALREARVWGDKERLYERLLPQLDDARLARLIQAASLCDGLIKGLRHPDWPATDWDGLRRLTLMMLDMVRVAQTPRRGAPPLRPLAP